MALSNTLDNYQFLFNNSEKGVLKSPTVIMNLSIFPFTSTSFCFVCFEAILKGPFAFSFIFSISLLYCLCCIVQ
jgi:hypothetical protein